jgi:hypothetical protein
VHAAAVHSSSHPAAVHSSSHPAAVPATTATAMAATAATAASERRRRKGKRGTERACDEATKDPVVHPNLLRVVCCDGDRRRKKDHQQTQMIRCFQMTNATVSDAEVSLHRSARGRVIQEGSRR